MASQRRSGAFPERADQALWLACATGAAHTECPRERAELLLQYLATFPTGRHNRAAAEAVELCLDEVREDEARATLRSVLRSLRDPFFPPVAPICLVTYRTPDVSA